MQKSALWSDFHIWYEGLWGRKENAGRKTTGHSGRNSKPKKSTKGTFNTKNKRFIHSIWKWGFDLWNLWFYAKGFTGADSWFGDAGKRTERNYYRNTECKGQIEKRIGCSW